MQQVQLAVPPPPPTVTRPHPVPPARDPRERRQQLDQQQPPVRRLQEVRELRAVEHRHSFPQACAFGDVRHRRQLLARPVHHDGEHQERRHVEERQRRLGLNAEDRLEHPRISQQCRNRLRLTTKLGCFRTASPGP
jgi:hypothetical protein